MLTATKTVMMMETADMPVRMAREIPPHGALPALLAGPSLSRAVDTLLGMYRSQLSDTEQFTNREQGGRVGALRKRRPAQLWRFVSDTARRYLHAAWNNGMPMNIRHPRAPAPTLEPRTSRDCVRSYA